MKTICRNCHFLAKREDNTGRPLTFALTEAERLAVESDPDHAIKDHFSIKCQLGVWDEGVAKPTDSRDVTLNKVQRKNACFFFPYHPAMLFEAAKELQARQDENRQLKRSNMYTRIGLWIAAGALAVDAIVTYFKE
jgi:hypothetical protein